MSEESTRKAPEARPSSPPSPPPKQGDVLAGKYRVERVLGEGGMGIVVAATHLQLQQTVALKFMLPRALVNKEAVGRFEREARAAVRLKSPHVAKVLDTGTLENGSPYMVMEYLEGETLAALVRSAGGGLPIDVAVDYLLQACEGVAEAHSQGVIHRDLKPANLFLTTAADGSPTVKVLDFGVSKVGALASSSGDSTANATQGIVGSPLYMSPEQMKSSRDVDARTDVWSLGVSLFELLTAKVPFEAETVHQQYAMLMLADPPKPSAVRPDIPPDLDAIVVKCLQRERADRFADVGELARALEPFAPEHSKASIARIARTLSMAGKASQSIRPVGVAPASASGPSPAFPRTDVTWGGTTAHTGRTRTKRSALIAAAVGAVGLAVIASIAVIGRKPPSDDRPAVATPTAPATVVVTQLVTATATAAPPPPAIVVPSASASASAKLHTARPAPTPTSDTVDLNHRK